MSMKQPIGGFKQQDGAAEYLQDDPYQMNNESASVKELIPVANSIEDGMHLEDQCMKLAAENTDKKGAGHL
jgi:hypothetical protein